MDWNVAGPSTRTFSGEIAIPREAFGRIIGKGGSTMRSLSDMPGISSRAYLDKKKALLQVKGRSKEEVEAVLVRVQGILERRRHYADKKRVHTTHVEGEILIPDGLWSYVIGNYGGYMRKLRSMPGVEFLQYYNEQGVIKTTCKSVKEMNNVMRDIENRIDKYDPTCNVYTCILSLDLTRWTASEYKVKITAPIGAFNYIISQQPEPFNELRHISGINFVAIAPQNRQTLLVGGDEEAALDEVKKRMQGIITRFKEETKDAVRRTVKIPITMISWTLTKIKSSWKSHPSIYFVELLDDNSSATVEICGETAGVVAEVEFEMKDMLNRYNSRRIYINQKLHFDFLQPTSINISFIPVSDSDIIDFTAYIPGVRSYQAETFFHLNSGHLENQEQSWALELTECDRRVSLNVELMSDNFGNIITLDERVFLSAKDPRVEVKLGVIAFYDMYLHTPKVAQNNDHGNSAETNNILHWWDYRCQFSGKLKISQDRLSSMLTSCGFRETGTETHTSVHVMDTQNGIKYSAIFTDGNESDNITPKLTQQKSKHLTLDIVKLNGSMSTRTMLISENPADKGEVEKFLTSETCKFICHLRSLGNLSSQMFEDNILSSKKDELFTIECIRIVKNTTFWDGEYGIYVEEVKEAATHNHGQATAGVEVVMTCNALNEKMLDIQETGGNNGSGSDGGDGSDGGGGSASSGSDDCATVRLGLLAECKDMFKKLVNKGRDIANKVDTSTV